MDYKVDVVDNSIAESAELALAWRKGETPGPMQVELFPTNKCNLQCKHCWQRTNEYDKTYQSELSDERLLRIVEEGHAMGVKYWVIKGGGEPMARGKLVMQLCEKICALGMNGILHTNGTLFKKAQIEALVAMGWFEVCFSLDAADAETNDHLRTGGFEKAKAALETFREVRERLGTPYPVIRLTTVVTRTNFRDLDKMVAFAHASGALYLNCGGMIEHTEHCEEFILRPEDKAELAGYVEKARLRAEELGVVTNLESFLDEEITGNPNAMEYGPTFATKQNLEEALCFTPFTEFVVHVDGRVGPCCMSFDDRSNNVNTLTLQEAWMGPYMTSVREHFLHNRPMTYCAHCPTSHYPRIGQIRSALKAQVRQAEMGAGEKVLQLAGRTFESIKRRGFARTVKRAQEWVTIKMR